MSSFWGINKARSWQNAMRVQTFLRSRVLQRYVPFLSQIFDEGIMGNTDVLITIDVWSSCTRSAGFWFGKYPDSLPSLFFLFFPWDVLMRSVHDFLVKGETSWFGGFELIMRFPNKPVVGLDAEGTRDLVTHQSTGLLLSPPHAHSSDYSKKGPTSILWPKACNTSSPYFQTLAKEYAKLLAEVVLDHQKRKEMGQRGSTEGIAGRTWWDAMEVRSFFLFFLT